MLTAGDLRTAMIPTPVKTSAYTAHHGDFVLVDTTAASVTITLPLSPPQNSVVGAKQVATASGHATTITAAGAASFNLQGGATTLTLTLPGQGVIVQYNGGVWVVQSDDLPLSQLDSRYSLPWGFLPSDAGYLAWTFDPATASQVKAFGLGGIVLARVNVRSVLTVTNVVLALTAGGSVLTANQNFAGLYNSSGTLIASTADQSAVWNTAGVYQMTLTGGPYVLQPGFYWVALLANGSTAPTLLAGSTATTQPNAGFTVATARGASSGGSKTSLANITPASSSFAATAWAAIS